MLGRGGFGIRPYVWIAALSFGLLAGFAVGCNLKGMRDAARIERLSGDIARLEARHAEERSRAAAAAAARLAAAQEAEQRAVLALDATRARLAKANERLKERIHDLSNTQCGLSVPAVGLLDDAIRGGALPEGAAAFADTASESAESAARPGASEAAVAGWIADAITLYDECRARIDAIRQWDEVTYGR